MGKKQEILRPKNKEEFVAGVGKGALVHLESLDYETPRKRWGVNYEYRWIEALCYKKVEIGNGHDSGYDKYHFVAQVEGGLNIMDYGDYLNWIFFVNPLGGATLIPFYTFEETYYPRTDGGKEIRKKLIATGDFSEKDFETDEDRVRGHKEWEERRDLLKKVGKWRNC